MMHFFNQLVEHRCTLISVVISGVIAVLLDKFLKRKSNDLSSNDSIKRKNRLITFGITTELCEEHMRKEFDCGNFNCNYGKLRFILNLIDDAKKTLDVCVYIITGGIFETTLLKAQRRGVKIRVITDGDESSSSPVLLQLRKNYIPIRQKISDCIMHHKFVIVDGELLISGSMNFTMTGVFSNVESVLVTIQESLVKSFIDAFQDLWIEFDPRKQHDMRQNKK